MKKAIEIATQEIDHHEKLKDTEIPADYRRGFINGMYHLRNLFRCGMSEAEIIQCPVCGYYCLGKGGFGCIDKPGMLPK